jgi:hypothetical protein
MIGNSESEYALRIKTIKNDGEYLFEKFCTEHECDFYKIGFDENEKNVPKFWHLNAVLRNLPDYVIIKDRKIFVVLVKGTDSIKRKEMILLPEMIRSFDSEKAPLIYAFCFKENEKPIWKSPQEVMDLYDAEEDRQWSDGVVYRNLKLRKEK